MHTLLGRTAIVTGAASDRSIGWGIARALALAGADVAVNDVVMPEALDARVDEIRGLGRRSVACLADVTKPDQVGDMIRKAVSSLGRLDIVVSNAGIIRWEHFLDLTPANMHAVINVNLKGTAFVCQAAARQMIAQGDGGRIVINSSVQSAMQFPITPVYGATKKAMHTLVGVMALELAAHSITVNHIGPGWVLSPMNDASPELQSAEGVEAQRRAVPLQRDGHLDEMGAAAVYLAGPDAAYITGAFLLIDGGLGIGKYAR